MTAPNNWGQQVAPRDVHTPPSEVAGAQLPSQSQLLTWGRNLIEGIVKEVVRLVTGVLLPGPAGQQLTDWAFNLFDTASSALGNWTSLFSGIPGVSTVPNFLGFLQPTTSTSGIFAPLINGITGGTTNPLSSLLSNLLGTASTASTANTNASTGLSNWSTLLAGLPGVSTISSLLSFLNPASSSNGIFAPLINLVTGGTTNPLSTLGSSLTGTASTASTASTNASSALSSIQTTVDGLAQAVLGGSGTGNAASTVKTNFLSVLDGLFNNITKQSGSGRTNAQVAQAVSDQTDQIAASAAAIQALASADQASSNSGVSALEDFEYTNATTLDTSLWNLEWLQGTSAGVYLAVADGHNAGMIAPASPLGSNVTMQEFAQFKGTNFETLTDYQDVSVVVAQKMTAPFGGFTPPAIDVYGAMNTARTQWVRARFRADGIIEIAYRNGGAVSAVQASTSGNGNPAVGAALRIRCGTSGGLRIYQAVLNGSIKAAWTDGGSVTARGSSNRQGGWGQQWSDDNPPGKVTQWTMADNAPVAVTGTTFRAYRAATGGASKTTGDQYLASVFDTVDYVTSDLSWNASTSTLTVTKAGTYSLACRIEMSAALSTSEHWYTFFDIGGTVKARGPEKAGITLAAFGAPAFPTDVAVGGDSPTLYVPAGGTIRVGMGNTGGTLSLIGDAGGVKTWFSAVRIG